MSEGARAVGAIKLILARRRNPFWFYRPQLYWFGWATLSPIRIGHDEYARRTLVLGWTVTGNLVIALGDCGDVVCRNEAIDYMAEDNE